MNWLAHTLLSKQNIDYQLGNVLADPLKGKAWQGASQDLKDGMRMHKAIDRFTDGHDLLTVSKARLGEGGLLKGVVLDLLYDHFLSVDWSRYCTLSLDDYLNRFNQQAIKAIKDYPERPGKIVNRMVQSNLLGQYQDLSGFADALKRIDRRLSVRLRQRETTHSYLPVIKRNYYELKADFSLFFPALADHFKTHSSGSKYDHFLMTG
jgi:acyl carrier protein phosphodiesterase